MPYVRRDYVVETGLLDDAKNARDWYRETGMKVATPPAIPEIVAAWILRNCIPQDPR